MIIDDDIGNVRFLSVLLEENGYETVCAMDGLEGMVEAKREVPDLIVLDVMMPRKTGLSFLLSIKKERVLRDIPVIMQTAISDVLTDMAEGAGGEVTFGMEEMLAPRLKEIVGRLRKDGKNRPEIFIDKPIDPDTFINHVKSLIGPA